jgi:signal transduction protein with GAF and PtsI domain
MDKSHKTVQAERASLFLVDHEKKELWTKVALGLKDSEIIRVKMGEGIAGQVASTGNCVLIQDAYADARFSHSHDDASGFKTRDILCCPVLDSGDTVIAVVQFLNKREGTFDDNDVKLAELLCSHVALFIETVEGSSNVD